jgi:drug/metabolite transporter (DMT)-like permease
MNLSRSALVASVATVVLWTAKAGVIAVSGEGNSIFESILFLLGLLACVVAGVLVGAAAFAHRAIGWRALGAVLSFVVVSVLGALVQVAVVAVQPPHPGWVYGEINLWVIMLALLGAALLIVKVQESRTPEVAASLGAREDTRDRDRGTRARAGSRTRP